MPKLALKKDRITITELLNRWEHTFDDFVHIIENSALDVYVRPIALRAAVPPNYAERLERCPLEPTKVYRLIQDKQEQIKINDFQTTKIPVKTDIAFEITLGDVVVLMADVKDLEREYTEDACDTLEILSTDYRNIRVGDKEYSFGEKQAAVVKYLYEQMQAGDPWVHGKTLLKIADSAGIKMHGLFNRNKNWRQIIKSDSHGRYRLDP